MLEHIDRIKKQIEENHVAVKTILNEKETTRRDYETKKKRMEQIWIDRKSIESDLSNIFVVKLLKRKVKANLIEFNFADLNENERTVKLAILLDDYNKHKSYVQSLQDQLSILENIERRLLVKESKLSIDFHQHKEIDQSKKSKNYLLY